MKTWNEFLNHFLDVDKPLTRKQSTAVLLLLVTVLAACAAALLATGQELLPGTY